MMQRALFVRMHQPSHRLRSRLLMVIMRLLVWHTDFGLLFEVQSLFTLSDHQQVQCILHFALLSLL